MNVIKNTRLYVRHHWIAHNGTATCFVCGIGERTWENGIKNASMLEWDCVSIRNRNKRKK